MNNLIVVSSQENAARDYLNDFCQKNGIARHLIFEVYPEKNSFSVEQVREIVRLSSRLGRQKAIFALWNFERAGELVQNVMLKTLEEHNESVHFLLIAATQSAILPTVLSRCHIIALRQPPQKLTQKETEYIETIIQKAQKGVPISAYLSLSAQNKKTKATEFLNQLLHYGYSKLLHSTEAETKRLTTILKNALQIRQGITNNNLDPELAINAIFL